MRRPFLILAPLVLLGLLSGSPAPAVARDTAPVASAVVALSGPSVTDTFARLAGTNIGADAVRARADKLAPLLMAAERAVAAQQAPVVSAAERLGIDVVSRYSTAVNGLLVHGTPAQLAELARVPGVILVEPAPRVRPALSRSVPGIGADVLAADLGYDGEGTVVAIFDTGIDYTHAGFGGPGTIDAYAAARAAAETIDDTWEGQPLFPTAKVVGGWDFVGPNYTTPELCPPDAEAAGACTSTPHPDPDPMDEGGHGTSVAGIVAGEGTESVHPGVAPGATLVSLKIYGPPKNSADTDEAVDIVIDAIEWCVRVNLGLAVDGTIPPEPMGIDVINMSIGEPFAQGSRLFDEAIGAAVESGIVVASAAGNKGAQPFVTAAPGASPRGLSVASIAMGGAASADSMSGHSSRGPSKNGALKPDIAAPGSGIVTARMGSGDGGGSASGTSMATPHIAGAAALMHHRSRAEDLGLSAAELSALLMNYARPMLPSVDGRAAPVPVPLQGAGRLDVARAGTGSLLVTAGDIASLYVGPVSASKPVAVPRTFNLRNLSDAPVTVELGVAFAEARDRDAGVSVVMPEGAIQVQAGAAIDVPVEFRVDPASLRNWTLRGATPINRDALTVLEVDGYLTVTPTGDPDATPVTVPFYVLPRRASAIGAEADPEAGWLRLDNAAPFSGDVEVFTLPYGHAAEDPDEPDVIGEIDLRRVGVRLEPGAGGETLLTFGVLTHEVAAVPQVTSDELYLDLDRDGAVETRVRTVHLEPLGNTIGVVVGTWDAEAGAVVGPERPAGIASFDLHTRVTLISVPLSALGLSEPAPFDFYLVRRGLTEDWLGAPMTDVIPNDVDGPCGRVLLRVEPAAWSGLPERWTLTVEGDGVAEVRRSGGSGDRTPALLALLPDNELEARDAQHVILAAGADPEPEPTSGRCRVYMPLSTKAHALKPLAPPDAMFAAALDGLDGPSDVKMIYDITDYRDSAQSVERNYRFRDGDKLRVTYSQRTTLVKWDYIRVGSTVWAMEHMEGRVLRDWHCHAIRPDLVFWPEFVGRFRTEFPSIGWEIEGRSPYDGRTTWLLRNRPPGDPASYLVRIDVETGMLMLLSRYDPATRLEVFKLFDFGVPNEDVGPVRTVVCP